MKLNDKAAEPPDVTLVSDILESFYQLQEDDPELVPADELTEAGEFPQYGDFMEVNEKSPVDGTFRGSTWLLVTRDLAQWLVEEEVTSEDWWVVRESEKVDGAWSFEIEVVTDD